MAIYKIPQNAGKVTEWERRNLLSPQMAAEQLFLMSQIRAQFPLAVYLSNMFMASDVCENGYVVTTSVGVGWPQSTCLHGR